MSLTTYKSLFLRHSTTHQDQLRYDEDMGPETVKTSAKSKRAAKAIADLRKGDDKQTRKAAETVTRVIPKFIFRFLLTNQSMPGKL